MREFKNADIQYHINVSEATLENNIDKVNTEIWGVCLYAPSVTIPRIRKIYTNFFKYLQSQDLNCDDRRKTYFAECILEHLLESRSIGWISNGIPEVLTGTFEDFNSAEYKKLFKR